MKKKPKLKIGDRVCFTHDRLHGHPPWMGTVIDTDDDDDILVQWDHIQVQKGYSPDSLTRYVSPLQRFIDLCSK